MSGGYTADREQLARHAKDFHGHAEEATDIVGELRRVLEAAGTCWGTDSVGQSFAAGHVRAANALLDRLGGLPAQLGTVAQRFTDTGRTYHQAEQDSSDAVRSAGSDTAAGSA